MAGYTDAATAYIVDTKRRPARPAQQRLNVQQLADEVATLIVIGERKADPRITWRKDGRAVKVNLSEILPPPAAMQTQQGRSKRFYAALEAELLASGYSRQGAGAWFVRGTDH